MTIYAGGADKIWHKSVDGHGLEEWLHNKLQCLPWKWGRHSKNSQLGYDVVMKMIQPYMNKNHHVYFDNFFSSPVPLEHLELQQTYACSTVWYNRKGLPACASNKLTRPGQLVQAEKGNIVFTKWHDKRDVAVLPLMFLQEKLRALLHSEHGWCWPSRSTSLILLRWKAVKKVVQISVLVFFNLAACNTYILESESCVKRAQDLFRLQLGKPLIGNFNSRKRPASDALPLVSRAPLTHISTKIKGCKRQCVNCKAKGKKTPKNYPIETKFVSTVQSCALSRPVFPRLPH